MGNRVDISEVKSFYDMQKRETDQIIEGIHAIRKNISQISKMKDFQGKTAEAAKLYFSQYHGVILDEFETLFRTLEQNLQQHLNAFSESVDASSSARLESNYLMDQELELEKRYEQLEGQADEINRIIRSISDISSVSAPSLTPVPERANDAQGGVVKTRKRLDSFTSVGKRDISSAQSSIAKIESLLKKSGGRSKVRSSDWFEKQLMVLMKELMKGKNLSSSKIDLARFRELSRWLIDDKFSILPIQIMNGQKIGSVANVLSTGVLMRVFLYIKGLVIKAPIPWMLKGLALADASKPAKLPFNSLDGAYLEGKYYSTEESLVSLNQNGFGNAYHVLNTDILNLVFKQALDQTIMKPVHWFQEKQQENRVRKQQEAKQLLFNFLSDEYLLGQAKTVIETMKDPDLKWYEKSWRYVKIFGPVAATQAKSEVLSKYDFLENPRQVLSTAMDFVPLIGNFKGGAEAITGKDYITGYELENWERGVAGLAIIGGGLVKAGSKGYKLARNSLFGSKSHTATRDLTKVDSPTGRTTKGKTVDDILKEATPGRATKGRATQYDKSGGYNQAMDDFNNMGVTNIREIPNGRVGTLPDGRTVNVRNKSSDGRPTLEIFDGKNSIKIRYGE
ncbi:T7SS effector LXG polymorphic toxin [Litchfieldia alkalitelluris]|nr:T7SS effector LXG polymorphic toxin [Litchfieldia alkalitelluris]